MLFALLRLSVEAQAEGEVGNPLENLERRIARLEERLSGSQDESLQVQPELLGQ
jgi:hypothetical protein